MSKENKKYKDTVFRDLFGTDEKANERFIALYNALHGSGLDGHTDIRALEIEQVLYMNFANDIARLVNNTVIVLAEHQSTINENMPLRCLQYIGRIYEKIQEPRSKYCRHLVKIPRAEFYVFYNGTEDYPVEKDLKLSDAFIETEEQVQLEVRVKVININTNKGNKVLQTCPVLGEYSRFVEVVRKHLQKDPQDGYTTAIKECLSDNILKEYLQRKSTEVVNMLLTEYDYATDIAVQREEALLEGVEQGIQQGIQQGKSLGLAEGAHQKALETAKLLKRLGDSVQKIAQATGLSVKEIEEL